MDGCHHHSGDRRVPRSGPLSAERGQFRALMKTARSTSDQGCSLVHKPRPLAADTRKLPLMTMEDNSKFASTRVRGIGYERYCIL